MVDEDEATLCSGQLVSTYRQGGDGDNSDGNRDGGDDRDDDTNDSDDDANDSDDDDGDDDANDSGDDVLTNSHASQEQLQCDSRTYQDTNRCHRTRHSSCSSAM